ncbi:11173_t:CDS:2 [Gigaspora margarita]|uniref:11173_t:CDS:1 n=1 Tax=Gigaspora margarita TaxID=4874 RepID=A0ABN7VK45_GIGMA|nr:11173_t:CDS:2 [Gigaspora margarita]
MRKASYRKLAKYVADIQEKLEILQAKKEYINNILNEENGKKTNLGSIKQLNYMGQILFLEAEVNNIKNFKLQKDLIKLIQINENLLADIFKLESQICLLSQFIPKNFIDLEIFAENQIKDETIELLVAEEINQKMKEIQDNWKKKKIL